jgi:hypothetical protein
MTVSWARLRIRGPPWAAWVKFPGATSDQAEKLAMKMVADLGSWWEVRAEYQVTDQPPMEE